MNLYFPKDVCRFCHEPSLMGWHPRCLLEYQIRQPQFRRTILCSHCPFRRDIPVWLDDLYKLINRMRIARGFVQSCHLQTSCGCGGNKICNEGGNALIYSPAEFSQLKTPKTLEEARTRYDATPLQSAVDTKPLEV